MSIAPPSLTDASPPGSRLVEIRAYKLVPGTRAEFHLAMSRALELVRDYGMDVVAHGHSSEEDGYFLIRAFDDRAHLKAQQDGLAALCSAAGFGFGVHRTDHPPETALLTLYAALGVR